MKTIFEIRLVITFLILILTLDYKAVSSQENFESILGTIDIEPITSYDLSQRIKILLKSLDLEDNVQNRDNIRKRTIDLLIEEKIKMLESKKEEFNYFQEWGIGRHYQGSQLFDYWRNPFGQTHEHQTDGDMFDNTFPTRDLNVITDEAGLGQEPAESQWGPAISNTFGNKENG